MIDPFPTARSPRPRPPAGCKATDRPTIHGSTEMGASCRVGIELARPENCNLGPPGPPGPLASPPYRYGAARFNVAQPRFQGSHPCLRTVGALSVLHPPQACTGVRYLMRSQCSVRQSLRFHCRPVLPFPSDVVSHRPFDNGLAASYSRQDTCAVLDQDFFHLLRGCQVRSSSSGLKAGLELRRKRCFNIQCDLLLMSSVVGNMHLSV